MNTNTLKIIACFSMLLDHVGVVFFSSSATEVVFRTIGRISFPIFVFCLVEGFFKTSNKQKHLMLLIIFATISECFYDRAFGYKLDQQNVLWTFAIGFAMMWLLNWKKDNYGMQVVIALVAISLAVICKTDYSALGMLTILFGYYSHDNLKTSALLIPLPLLVYGSVTMIGTILSAIFLLLYNGQKGKYNLKYAFYAFYPVHLAIIGIGASGAFFGGVL